MEKYVPVVNKLFLDIEKIHNKTKKVYTHKKTLSILDAVGYAFMNSHKNNSKGKAISFIKDVIRVTQNKKIDDSCFQRKLNNISVDLFKTLYHNTKDTLNKIIENDIELQEITKILTNNYVELKDNNGEKITPFAVDGMCSNKIENGKLTTKEDLFIYNTNSGIVEDICCDSDNVVFFHNNVNNESDKNGELGKLIKFIELKHNILKNKILIMDRLYSSYKLFSILKKYNIKYVIRMKECLDLLKPINEIKKNVKYYKDIIDIKNDNNIKFVKYCIPTKKKILTKTNESVIVEVNSKYTLITNLGNLDTYSDELIQNLYKARWNIEVNNKKLKENFNFETYYGNDNDFMKQKYIALTNEIIIKFLVLVCAANEYKLNKKKFDSTVKKRKPKKLDMRLKINKEIIKEYEKCSTYKAIVNINFKEAADGFYSYILLKIIYNNLNIETLHNFNIKCIKVIKYKRNRVYDRKSIMPYTKWYVKMYHKKYEYEKIINAITNDTIDLLNKNLKTKANEIKRNLIKQI